MCAQEERTLWAGSWAQWGSPTPSFMTQMERGPAENSVMFGLQGEWSRPEVWRCRGPFSQDEARGNTGLRVP